MKRMSDGQAVAMVIFLAVCTALFQCSPETYSPHTHIMEHRYD